MKILQVLHNHPPEFRGGVERYIENLCASLRTLGHAVAVCCGSDEQEEVPTLREETWEGVPVFRLVRGLGFRNPADPVEPGLVGIVLKGLELGFVHRTRLTITYAFDGGVWLFDLRAVGGPWAES